MQGARFSALLRHGLSIQCLNLVRTARAPVLAAADSGRRKPQNNGTAPLNPGESFLGGAQAATSADSICAATTGATARALSSSNAVRERGYPR